MVDLEKSENVIVKKQGIKGMDLRGLALLGVLIILVIIFSFLAPNFLKLANFMNLGMYSATLAITAAGMTFVIIAGGVDISVGAIMSVCGIFTAYLVATINNAFLSVIA